MSVIVKGMEMPGSCLECRLSRKCLDNDFKQEQAMVSAFFSKRPNFCPLVKLPDKHDRLISAKRIEFELCESNMPKQYRDFCRRVLNDENLTPTVVESEE